MTAGKADCGMLYAAKWRCSGVAYCALSIRCGTRNEEGFHSGIAHFTEHTLFKGTAYRSGYSINNYLDRLGGELNAFTTKEEIVLQATVLKEDLSKAVGLLLELASSATFPEKEIETEKGVVIDEIKSYKDSPADDVYDSFEGMLFKGHPLGRPILGTADSVRKITSEELGRFVRKNFVPEAMALTIVADFDEKTIEKKINSLISRYFPSPSNGLANYAAAGIRPESGSLYFAPQTNIFDKTVDKRNHEANAVIGGIAPSLYDEEGRLAAILLGNILAGPASNSVLNNILREKHGWVYGVETSYTQYSDTGIFAICLGCEKENLGKCFDAISKEIGKLQDAPLSENRLRAAKKQLLGQLAISSEGGESKCLGMGKSLLAFGRIAPDKEIREGIEAITGLRLMETARRLFNKDTVSRLIYL